MIGETSGAVGDEVGVPVVGGGILQYSLSFPRSIGRAVQRSWDLNRRLVRMLLMNWMRHRLPKGPHELDSTPWESQVGARHEMGGGPQSPDPLLENEKRPVNSAAGLRDPKF